MVSSKIMALDTSELYLRILSLDVLQSQASLERSHIPRLFKDVSTSA